MSPGEPREQSPRVLLDGGACPGRIESTVMDTGWAELLRHGSVTQEEIEAVVGKLGHCGTIAGAEMARAS